jgi:hypothetical protein
MACHVQEQQPTQSLAGRLHQALSILLYYAPHDSLWPVGRGRLRRRSPLEALLFNQDV